MDLFGGRPIVLESPTCALSIVWGTYGGIQVTHSATGSTWTKPLTVTPWAGNDTHPAAVSNAEGKLNIMYRRTGPTGTTVFSVGER